MNRLKRACALYRRPTKKGRHIYYAKIRDSETSVYRSFLSTGCTRRDEAVIWCEKHLAQRGQARNTLTFSDYVKGFWLPDGAYAMGRTARGFSMSRTYLTLAETYTRTHLVPAFGPLGLQSIISGRIDEWVVRLRKTSKFASAAINRVLQHLRTILAQAAAEGKILENPAVANCAR